MFVCPFFATSSSLAAHMSAVRDHARSDVDEVVAP
jgi:hypothetical protein